MIKYLDSGQGGPQECVGRWLDQELRADIMSFRGQFGFYDGSALRKYLPNLRSMLDRGGTLRLVLGSNPGDPPTTDDLESIISLLVDDVRTKLSVIGFNNALFHPKCIHIVTGSSTPIAMVGSANFTSKGLGHNVESALILESDPATDPIMKQIAGSIDYWGTCLDTGVYQVRTRTDIDNLKHLGLAVTSGTKRRLRNRQRSTTIYEGRGSRLRGWHPPPRQTPSQEEVVGSSEQVEAAAAAPSLLIDNHTVSHRWAKLLKKSDAQQVSSNTNPTGKLRLGRTGFPINQTTWFRDIFFGDEDWVEVERSKTIYEEVHCRFNVSKHGEPWFELMLKVDHAPHRVANQNNVPTVLSWGPILGSWLRNNDQIGNWVALTKDEDSNYWLSIQESRPEWMP